MSLSLPLPKMHEALIDVCVLRRLPRLRFIYERALYNGGAVDKAKLLSVYK